MVSQPDDAANCGGKDGRQTEASAHAIPPWFTEHLNAGRPLSPELQAVVHDVISPLYHDLVVTQTDPVLRAAGNAAVVTHAIEVIGQPGILTAAKRALGGNAADCEDYAKVLGCFLKVGKERDKSMRLLLLLRKAQRVDRLERPGAQPGDGAEHGTQPRKFSSP